MNEEPRPLDLAGPGDGRAVYTQPGISSTLKVTAEQTGGAYSLFELAVESDGGEQPHIQHREDECLYVLSGKFEFVIESEALAVSGGDSVYIAKGTLHGYENVGDSPGRLLAIYTPGGTHERFVEEAEKLSRTVSTVSNGPSNLQSNPEAGLERLRSLGAGYGIEIVRDRRSSESPTQPVRD